MTTTMVRNERTLPQKEYDQLVLERVQRGMQLLETKYGPAWVDHIDLKTLNLSSGASCVLGQVYAADALASGADEDGYDYGIHILFDHLAAAQDAIEYGFLAPTWNDPTLREGAWDELQAAWEHALAPLVQECA